MSNTKPKSLTAHVNLLQAVDQLIEQADKVREKRKTLSRMIGEIPKLDPIVQDCIDAVVDVDELPEAAAGGIDA